MADEVLTPAATPAPNGRVQRAGAILQRAARTTATTAKHARQREPVITWGTLRFLLMAGLIVSAKVSPDKLLAILAAAEGLSLALTRASVSPTNFTNERRGRG